LSDVFQTCAAASRSAFLPDIGDHGFPLGCHDRFLLTIIGLWYVIGYVFGILLSGGAMPRRPRLAISNIPLHLIQCGNNRQACFFATEDYLRYLEWLEDYAVSCACRIYAWVLMTNHVHLLLSSEDAVAQGAMMKALGQRYVQYVNRVYRRSGALWEGRYRSCLAQDDAYLLSCQRHI
jgi:REP element-mobilizing transposase RayT